MLPEKNRRRIEVPAALRERLAAYRNALLRKSAADRLIAAMIGVSGVFLVLFLFERWWEAPAGARSFLLAAVFSIVVWAGLSFARDWWGTRRPLQIASRIRQRKPAFGDDLVGVLELADSESEQVRSPALCAAALDQVARRADEQTFQEALPEDTFAAARRFLAGLLVLIVLATLLMPRGVTNTLARLVAPLSPTERYTFVTIDGVPAELVVPQNQPVTWSVRVSNDSLWKPRQALLSIGAKQWIGQPTEAGQYRFQLPALIESTTARLRLGDALASIQLVPKVRPEAISLESVVRFPDYLDGVVPDNTLRSMLGNSRLRFVPGSGIALRVEVSAPLKSASIDGKAVPVQGARFGGAIDPQANEVLLRWTDQDGLRPEQPLSIALEAIPDRPPTVMVDAVEIPGKVLASQTITFRLAVSDDYRIRRVGMRWESEQDPTRSGERVLSGPMDPTHERGQDSLAAFFEPTRTQPSQTVAAAFQGAALQIESSPTLVRFWVEDDLPGRGRIYSPAIRLDVVSAEEHAVWIAEQFDQWRQSALDARDRELDLFERNRQLQRTADDQRDQEWWSQLRRQADAEAANGRLLQRITSDGEDLLREAARNASINPDEVEQLAETLTTLKQLGEDSMPRVAQLLEQAAEEESKFKELLDQETSLGQRPEGGESADDKDSDPDGDSDQDENQQERLGLAGTTIQDTSGRDGGKADGEAPENADDQDPLDDAVEDQSDLVAEFDAISDELRELLGAMEGSTLVKRLKSISRMQDRVATELARQIDDTFGKPPEANRELSPVIVDAIVQSTDRLQKAVDDLQAFYQRRELEHFGQVLREIKSSEVLSRLEAMRDEVALHPGNSIAVAEYWADNIDRWADDLVDPGPPNAESGPKNTKSLSPATILEVLRILQSEVELRERTRVAEQGRQAMERDDYMAEAIRLSEDQDLLRDRVDIVVESLQAMPDGLLNFSAEIDVLAAASEAMVDATKTLVSPETGAVAIAAETEAIELLLRCKKVSPESGGGGGGDAGGGSGGDTDQAAVAMLGTGINALANVRESTTELAVGRGTSEVPQRLREEMDQYFDRLETRRAQRDRGSDGK
ncbi:hypothetical protein FYK55_08970 [Roseiconus nitratireducens]|uniref:DUF4175 family protein n=1 Tax=Roseiconus nitratireducens TaxID=2605748 RepID=A0A5M6DDT5_9BACT|nr:hypothetical protein [Roseiconus nitratireducens]KAA5544452.1 hypothetical protein FYK55_08970 [Roseiconus nitratireducens]